MTTLGSPLAALEIPVDHSTGDVLSGKRDMRSLAVLLILYAGRLDPDPLVIPRASIPDSGETVMIRAGTTDELPGRHCLQLI